MKTTSKWEVIIEYGPTASQSHTIIVDTGGKTVALKAAKEWVKEHYVSDAMYTVQPAGIPEESILDDDYSDIVEWTPEEEEEFLRITDRGNIDQN